MRSFVQLTAVACLAAGCGAPTTRPTALTDATASGESDPVAAPSEPSPTDLPSEASGFSAEAPGPNEGSSPGADAFDAGSGTAAVEAPIDAAPPAVQPTPAELYWASVETGCFDPNIPVVPEVWTWVPPPEEAAIVELDLDGDATFFGLLSDWEGTSIILRVRQTGTEANLAVVKTTSSNTRVDAEIYAWRLANFLGFGSLVAPTAPVFLDGEALQKMHDLLDETDYDDPNKESNRLRVVRQLAEALDAGGGYNGAIKPWIPAFSYVGALGERERLAAHPVMEFLDANNDQAGDELVTLEQFTRLYSPRGTQRGTLAMWELAHDVSNMLLLDALMGQNDRYAGANVHFRSLSGERIEVGTRRELPIYDLGAVRLFALDNGAALRGENGSGIGDLQGNFVSGTRVERFEHQAVDRIQLLARRVLGRGCPAGADPAEADLILAYLGLQPGTSEAERARGYLENVVEYIEELAEDEGDAMFLTEPPRDVAAPDAEPERGEGSGG